MKPVIIIAITILIIGVSITSISAQSQYDIPAWVKGVAGFWAEDKITDNEFGEGLSFLIDSQIIKVPKMLELENRVNQLQNENEKLRMELEQITTGKDIQKSTSISTTETKTRFAYFELVHNNDDFSSQISYDQLELRLFFIDSDDNFVVQDGTLRYKVELLLENGDYLERKSDTVPIPKSGNWHKIVDVDSVRLKTFYSHIITLDGGWEAEVVSLNTYHVTGEFETDDGKYFDIDEMFLGFDLDE